MMEERKKSASFIDVARLTVLTDLNSTNAGRTKEECVLHRCGQADRVDRLELNKCWKN